jgi:hypothetical protein
MAACGGSQAERPSNADVLAELSRRSELSEEQLQSRLRNCRADRQSGYLCAYREAVAADLSLRYAVAAKTRETPSCEAPLARAVAKFQQSRMKECKESAADLLSEASIEPITQARCIARTTNAMVEEVRRGTQCEVGVARR